MRAPRDGVDPSQLDGGPSGAIGDRGPLGLYLHIPFCEAICSYCNFNRGLLDGAVKRRYLHALHRELERAALGSTGMVADSLFFGGGTPSVLEPDEVGSLITRCRSAANLAPPTPSPVKPLT